ATSRVSTRPAAVRKLAYAASCGSKPRACVPEYPDRETASPPGFTRTPKVDEARLRTRRGDPIEYVACWIARDRPHSGHGLQFGSQITARLAVCENRTARCKRVAFGATPGAWPRRLKSAGASTGGRW